MKKYLSIIKHTRLFLLLLIIQPINVQNQVTEAIDGNNKEIPPEYFERDKSIKLVFDSDFGETISRIEETASGFKLINESDDFRYIQTLFENEDGLYLTETEQEVKVFLFIKSSADYSYPNPALQLPKNKKIGESWEWNGLQILDGDTSSVKIAGNILGEENITLPAGDFEVLKINYKIETSSGENTDLTQWIAPKIGIVKLEAFIDEPGLIGLALELFGFDEIKFELKEIIY